MPPRGKEDEKQTRPATSPEARENQMINHAVNLAEKQLTNGSASSAVIVHYLKLATEKEKLERIKLERDIGLTEAKAKSMAKEQEVERIAKEAMEAMKSYKPST
jgi:hypothetical protein